MGDSNTPIHIYVKPTNGQRLDTNIGWLSLPKATSFKVSVKEFIDEKDLVIKKHTKALKKIDDEYTKNFNEIKSEGQKSYDFIIKNYEEYLAGKVKKRNLRCKCRSTKKI
jgi:hypothetical protein